MDFVFINITAVGMGFYVYSWASSSLIGAVYTGCPRRNVPNFGRVFLMLNYTDITQNTYVQS